MRSDIDQVIVSQPSRSKRKRGKRYKKFTGEAENLPKQESMKIPHIKNWNDEKNNRSFDPLKRFLRSKVGQFWDKVYSEICQNVRGDIGRVIRERLQWYVELNCQIIDGEVYDSKGLTVDRWPEFYVHPISGVLCYGRDHKKFKHKKAESKIWGIGKQQYFCHNGIWYRVRMKEYHPIYNYTPYKIGNHTVNSRRIVNPITDVFGHDSADRYSVYGGNWVAVWKEQAGRRECKILNKTKK